MPRWNLFRPARAALILLASLWLATVITLPSAAQVRIPSAALVDQAAIERVLNQGLQLEQARRWAEAISHYEEAVRDFPERTDLKQRLELARIHFDVARRYADSSFVGALTLTDEREALDLYAEVLLKIQTHYVGDPDWRELVRKGLGTF